jgi:hypothetical protein
MEKCPACGRRVGVYVSGRFYAHIDETDGFPCPMSNKNPNRRDGQTVLQGIMRKKRGERATVSI